ncbi:IclR family transcriptional regulator [Pseudonocardia kujensis]|uniref:IclR family transcriptional regulator n=1 Tax=Pseudonocardia kujensis TaxID=1128675 RepID=UPI001E3C1436|nr:IclR family transcriptional regulator [Pseudonocardia kujensis]MCE0764602.1 IclR family transcriptional regulator [Pseudonocardia kujensis]
MDRGHTEDPPKFWAVAMLRTDRSKTMAPHSLLPTDHADGILERAAAILQAFDEDHRQLTLMGLVRRSGLPRSTVHRVAGRMVDLGWLVRHDGRYHVGNDFVRLSGLTPVRRELREAVQPFMQDLYETTRLTVQLGVLEDNRILIVDTVTGHRELPMLSKVGGTIPAHCSSLGRAILAHSPSTRVDDVVGDGLWSRTARTITDPGALRQELVTSARRGWAVDDEEGNVGIRCVGAALCSSLGEVVGALSVTGPAALVQPARLGPVLRATAAAASRRYAKLPPRIA